MRRSNVFLQLTNRTFKSPESPKFPASWEQFSSCLFPVSTWPLHAQSSSENKCLFQVWCEELDGPAQNPDPSRYTDCEPDHVTSLRDLADALVGWVEANPSESGGERRNRESWCCSEQITAHTVTQSSSQLHRDELTPLKKRFQLVKSN